MYGYKYASAFPGAIFTIPCDREASPLSSTAQSTSSYCDVDMERPASPTSHTTNKRTWSTIFSTASFDEENPADDSECEERQTWGRRPDSSYLLGPLIEIVSPWDTEDAKHVFGDTLRFGDLIKPRTPVERGSRTLSARPVLSPTERADTPAPWAAAAPPTPSRDQQINGGLTNTEPILRPDTVRSERVANLMRVIGLGIQTQNVSGYFRLPQRLTQ